MIRTELTEIKIAGDVKESEVSSEEVRPFKPFLEEEEPKENELPVESLLELLPRIEREKKKKNEKNEMAAAPMPTLSPPISLFHPIPSLQPIVALPPALLSLFETMVGMLHVSNENGVVETTLTLDAPKYASSPFFGAQILIREFSSAPKVFNIELIAHPAAIALLDKNLEKLLFAVQNSSHPYSVHRLETRVLEPEDRKQDQESSDNEKEGRNES